MLLQIHTHSHTFRPTSVHQEDSQKRDHYNLFTDQLRVMECTAAFFLCARTRVHNSGPHPNPATNQWR